MSNTDRTFPTRRFTDIEAPHLQVTFAEKPEHLPELVVRVEAVCPGLDSVTIELSYGAAEELAHHILTELEQNYADADDKEPPF